MGDIQALPGTLSADEEVIMRKKPVKRCRWCKAETDRRCGICLMCCEVRDRQNRLIDAGKAAYVPPEQRPGHRFYRRKQLNEGQKAALAKANASKQGKILGQTLQEGLLGRK